MEKNSITRRVALGGIVGAASAPHAASAHFTRDATAELVLPKNIFIADDLTTATGKGEAATREGDHFKVVGAHEQLAEIRVRTAGGSDLLYREPTAAALASEGAEILGYSAPYTGAVQRSVAGKFKDLVSVTDFGQSIASDATAAFANAFARAHEYGRDLYIPKLDAGAKYAIEGDLSIPAGMKISGGGSGSGADRASAGSLLEFEDGSLLARDAAGLTLENFQVRRVGKKPGPAIDFTAVSAGTARNFLNNISIMGSTGSGARFSGTWLVTWLNPYIRRCADFGILAEEGLFVTGANSITLVGGEIQSCAKVGILLDRCKQFNIVGTAIEGNGIGIGLGKSASAVNILAYMEGNYNGHIVPYSHNGGAAGVAQCVVVQGGSQIQKGSGDARKAIHIPKCRQFHMEPGVWIIGYEDIAEPLIHIEDVGDSNRAFGSISGISVDCPAQFALQNDTFFFGDETRRHFYLNELTPDDVNSPLYTIPLWKGPTSRRNPSSILSVIVHFEVTTEGHVGLTCRGRHASGNAVTKTKLTFYPALAGYNRVSLTLQDSDDIAYVEVGRVASYSADTAIGVTISAVELLSYENAVKSK